jgi:hypothetical protein
VVADVRSGEPYSNFVAPKSKALENWDFLRAIAVPEFLERSHQSASGRNAYEFYKCQPFSLVLKRKELGS